MDRTEHWQTIYENKSLPDVSWYQPVPTTSLELIGQLGVSLASSIIDIGGGDSLLVDHLLDLGYRDVTVLDISEKSLQKAQERLGTRAKLVQWIVADASTFRPERQYDLWHDRAAFHFFTDTADIRKYLSVMRDGIKPSGSLIVGTFSENGPRKCSGIEIKQYSQSSLTRRFKKYFEKIKCFEVQHGTPFNTIQEFVFCSFRRLDLV
ncbi:class I SAM-dependent methyltransferase [Dyadobacter tibetensis]|uniref:class I SAM-dependent methyltransferase n=1 Tax=Dyadobacter tibetensis TaxID=1211851 RepID=UPI000470A939|nr:class I SAM-dependent methyltransferase [Dyadobacter tibetensis]